MWNTVYYHLWLLFFSVSSPEKVFDSPSKTFSPFPPAELLAEFIYFNHDRCFPSLLS